MDTPEDSPVDLTKWLKSSCSENLKMMIERIIENNYIDSPGITMAKVRAKREGQDELCKELERLLIDIQTPLYLENRKAEEKKVNDIHQHFLDINWQKKADERKWNSIKEEVRIKEQQILKKKREEEQRISAQRFAEEEERKRKEALESPVKNIWDLYFITHIDNLQSISEKGILSPVNVRSLGLHPVRIDDEEVNDRRNKTMVTRHLLPACQPKLINAGQCAHAFFNPCNAMFHVVLGKHHPKNIVIIEVSINVSDRGVYITDRNVAKSDVQCWDSSQYHKIIPQIERDTLPIGRTWDHSPVWCNDGSLSRVMAECLVQDKISRDHFKSIHVNSNDMIEKVQPLLVASPELEIIVDQNMFFNGQYD